MTEIEEVTAKAEAKRKLDMVQNRYYDHLHIPSAFLVVTYNDQELFVLNKRLLDQQLCWDNLEAIKEVHWLKIMFYDMILQTDDIQELAELAKDITECEFELQELWKFGKDINYHRFWDTPKCQCAKMDNDDNYPIGHYSRSGNCPLHGSHTWETK